MLKGLKKYKRRKKIYKINPKQLRKWQFSSVQSLSCVWLFVTPWIAARQASLSITNSGVHSNSCPSSQWCHPAISSSVVPFFSCPQSLPASESFPKSQLFAWGGQSTGVSASASFPPKNTQVELYKFKWLRWRTACNRSKELKPSHHAQPKAFTLNEIIPCNEGLVFKSD